VVLFCVKLNAQNKTTNHFEHQFELGYNYGNFFGNYSEFNGIGFLQIWDFKAIELLNIQKIFRRLNYTNLFYSYKIIINNKHCFKINKMVYNAYSGQLNNINIGFSDFDVELLNMGYGRNFNFKKINATMFLQLSQRTGTEYALLGFLSNHPLNAELKYNSYGIALGTDFDFFITKNLGLGLNINYYNYPFETNKLEGDDVQYVDPSIIENYKPMQEFVFINFKLAYKFALPKFGKRK
jgi:hypothetical protein